MMTKAKSTRVRAQVVKHLPNKCEAQTSNSSATTHTHTHTPNSKSQQGQGARGLEWQHLPVIPATQEVVMGRSWFKATPGPATSPRKVSDTLSENKTKTRDTEITSQN